MRTLFALGVLLLACGFQAVAQNPVVTAEEDIYTIVSPNNGSGPLWSFGCTPILRLGNRVFVAQMETGEGVPKLCNTRWRLLERTDAGWQMLAEAEGYRQREPTLLATAAPNTAYLYVNDSMRPPGTEYGPCEPHLLRFDVTKAAPIAPAKISPVWPGTPTFTDHSYRSYAADPANSHLLMVNIDAKTSDLNWSFLTAEGETLKNGLITFPIRSCYAQTALIGNTAHVLAVGDIVEPVKEWQAYKFEQTKQKWDYVFRILYLTQNPDLLTSGFAPPIEIANVDATAGHITNHDLWIAPNGDAYILYSETEVNGALMRDKFFPGKSILPALKLAIVRGGQVLERKTLVEAAESKVAGYARFHVAHDGSVYVFSYITGAEGGNFLEHLYPPVENPVERVRVAFEKPFTSFLLANTRAGNAPSNTIDVYGNRNDGSVISYGRIELK